MIDTRTRGEMLDANWQRPTRLDLLRKLLADDDCQPVNDTLTNRTTDLGRASIAEWIAWWRGRMEWRQDVIRFSKR